MKLFSIGIGCVLLVLSSTANAYIWSSAVPTEIQLVDGGLLLRGDFNNEGVTCATGPKGIFLPSSDSQFNRKLSVALLAITAGKKITVLINDPLRYWRMSGNILPSAAKIVAAPLSQLNADVILDLQVCATAFPLTEINGGTFKCKLINAEEVELMVMQFFDKHTALALIYANITSG